MVVNIGVLSLPYLKITNYRSQFIYLENQKKNRILDRMEETKRESEEKSSFHKLLILSWEFKNKATSTEEENEASGEPMSDSGEDYSQDLFRDRVRRIDVVLVAENDRKAASEEARSYFLRSIIKAGLEVEIEPGTYQKHRHLLFIKIHAPDKILADFHDIVGSKKHFKDTHIRYISSVKEQEWITLVRKQYKEPLKLSNIERSLIVYRILLQLPFGEYQNFIGINRLIDNHVFSHVYPLHDGPYFLSPDEDLSRINARQILFYNWLGFKHMFSRRPINLIREYFGERIGFYFAFYEHFNRATMVAALVGLIFFVMQYSITIDNPIRDDVCGNSNKSYICPRCYAFEVCPFRKLTSYCFSANIHIIFDSPLTILYAWFLVIWAFYFNFTWKRKEKFLTWLWEVNTNKFRRTFRPEFSISSKTKEECLRTGLIHNYDSRKSTSIMYVTAAFLFTMLDFYIHMRLALTLMYVIDQKYPFFSIYVIRQVPQFNEYFIVWPLRYITKLGNHRTYVDYDRSFTMKYFLITFMGAFAMLFYFAWVRGRYYLLPVKFGKETYYLAYNVYKYATCSPFTTCVDDVVLLLFGVIFARYGLVRLWGLLCIIRTDYKPGCFEKRYSRRIPPWEREYRLRPVTEEHLMLNYSNIVLQFALIILVGAVFPLAPMMILISNLFHTRCEARRLLLCSRRPLLQEDVGVGIWTDVVNILSYGSTLSNALTVAFTTKTYLRNIYLRKFNSMEGFLFYTLSPMDTEIYTDGKRYAYFKDALDHYKSEHAVPKMCYTPGLWTPPHEKKEHYFYIQFRYFNKVFELAYNAEYYELLTTRGLNIVFFNMATLFCVNVIQRLMPPISKNLHKIMDIEKELERRYNTQKRQEFTLISRKETYLIRVLLYEYEPMQSMNISKIVNIGERTSQASVASVPLQRSESAVIV